MSSKRFTREQIIGILRESEVVLAQGTSVLNSFAITVLISAIYQGFLRSKNISI